MGFPLIREPQIIQQGVLADSPLPANRDGREFLILDHPADLLAASFEQNCCLFDRQDLAHAQGS